MASYKFNHDIYNLVKCIGSHILLRTCTNSVKTNTVYKGITKYMNFYIINIFIFNIINNILISYDCMNVKHPRAILIDRAL